MVSGSQLQVAKLAQMCPAVRAEWCRRLPHYAARCRIVSNSAEWCQMVLNGAERCQMVLNSAKWCRTEPNGAEQCQPQDGAPCSTKLILELIILFSHLFYVLFKKKESKSGGPDPDLHQTVA